ncbi:hypothetical protein SAMN04490248_1486 [Salinihabitans flavidus]|uniref:Secreted protein n=1 Tax=Salinihabitans flavidus TaxID=569882 RepID=A0A1H8W7W0_9RHOB|nr:hypothetical protein [Salinihabitans flavidus]SEP23744.1 hypothetical protein SAMN04490248_1486 [Salinihabitans flavidus]
MVRFSAIRAAAAAATVLAAPATAKATSEAEIKVVVQSIAQLQVITGSSTTIMTDNTLTAAGDPSPLGGTSGMGHLQLSTNYCIGGIEFDFPTVTGIRGNPSAYYGAAEGLSTTNTLGVQPFVRFPTGSLSFGSLPALSGRATDAPLSASGLTYGLCDGTYDIFIGLVTRWDLTLPPEPMFAVPDTYRIPVTATIVSSP